MLTAIPMKDPEKALATVAKLKAENNEAAK